MKREDVIAELEKVTDPASGQGLISAGRIGQLQVEEKRINLTLQVPQIGQQEKSALIFSCVQKLQEKFGADTEVDIHLEQVMVEQAKNSPLPHVKNVIAVASGKGGVGKSTISTNLAIGLAELGAKVGILDADLYGPSIPRMLGLAGRRPKIVEQYGKHRLIPLEAYNIQVMSIGFIVEPEQAVVLRGPRLAGVIRQFIQECNWPPLDYLIVDLPPGTGDIQLTLVQSLPVTGAIIVTTPQQVAVDDAIKAMNMFLLPQIDVPVLGIVENMAWFAPPDNTSRKYYLFGKGGGKKLVKMSKSVLLGQIPIVEQVMQGGETGKPSILDEDQTQLQKALRSVAKNTARQVALRNEMLAPTQIVKVND